MSKYALIKDLSQYIDMYLDGLQLNIDIQAKSFVGKNHDNVIISKISLQICKFFETAILTSGIDILTTMTRVNNYS